MNVIKNEMMKEFNSDLAETQKLQQEEERKKIELLRKKRGKKVVKKEKMVPTSNLPA